MTQKEFTERTKVEVGAEEYDAIETVYMYSDLDKDEFCKLWCKMNPSRVKAAKQAAKEAAKKDAAKDVLFDLYTRMRSGDQTLAIDYLTDKERDALGYFGLGVWNYAWDQAKTVSDVWYDIYKLLLSEAA